MGIALVSCVVGLVGGIVCGAVAITKARNVFVWFAIGFLLPLIGVITIRALPPRGSHHTGRSSNGDLALRSASFLIGAGILAAIVSSHPDVDQGGFLLIYAWVHACLGILSTAVSIANPTLRGLAAATSGFASFLMIVATFGSSEARVHLAPVAIWFEVAMSFMVFAALGLGTRKAVAVVDLTLS